MTTHVRIWSGSLCAELTDMTNAGKRGKTCRVLRLNAGNCSGRFNGASSVTGAGEVLWFFQETLPKLGDESIDDVLVLVRALAAECPDFTFEEKTIRGVDAPVAEIVRSTARWSVSADETGVHVADRVDRANEPRSLSRGSHARSYAIAKKTIPTLADSMSYHDVVRALETAGIDLHSYCAVD